MLHNGQLKVGFSECNKLRSHFGLLLLHLVHHLVDCLQLLAGFVVPHQLYVVLTELSTIGSALLTSYFL